MAVVTLSAVVHPEDDLYVAECLSSARGARVGRIEQAIANVKDATGRYFKEHEEPLTVAPAILTTSCVVPLHDQVAIGTLRGVSAKLAFQQTSSSQHCGSSQHCDSRCFASCRVFDLCRERRGDWPSALAIQ